LIEFLPHELKGKNVSYRSSPVSFFIEEIVSPDHREAATVFHEIPDALKVNRAQESRVIEVVENEEIEIGQLPGKKCVHREWDETLLMRLNIQMLTGSSGCKGKQID
jgi:hypothetical protein